MKRERQYEHVKKSVRDRGESPKRAEEIVARTVNKERARSGESKTPSKVSTRDPKSASQRGGQRSHSGAEGPTKNQLYEEARNRNILGRSAMTKKQLQNALGR
ncbi:plasmid stabilization protein [Streptomyces chartreusis]|uniref:plasmid stabilization protein n=1 Tax=Streptomyces chartreusis TaxID=1969 RepID=UPI0037A826AB